MTRRAVLVLSVAVSLVGSLCILEAAVRSLRLSPDYKFYPGPFVAHPIWDYRLRPGYIGHQGDVLVMINSLGFRGPEPVAPVSAARVLLFGDSVAFGWGVPVESTFPRLLERRLREEGAAVEVLNASTPGHSPWHYRRMLEAEGDAWKPDLIVVTIAGNDFEERGWQVNAQGTLTMVGTEHLRNRFVETVFNNAVLSRHVGTYRLVKNAARDLLYREQRTVVDRSQSDAAVWAACFGHLTSMRAWAERRSIPLLVLNLAEGPAVNDLLGHGAYTFVSSEGYVRHRLLGDPHPNREGHALIAESGLQLIRPLLARPRAASS